MKWPIAGLVVLAGFAWLVLSAPHASATSNCQPTVPNSNVCEGIAMAGTTTGGVSSGRCFFLRITNSAPACTTGGVGTTSNEAGWEVDAGNCVTLHYFDVANGAAPPATPNKVTLRLRFDNTGTTIRDWQTNGGEPSNGASFTACGTSDGTSTGAARSGTFQIWVDAIKDNGPGGVGNYDVNSLTSGGTGSTAHDAGALRSAAIASSVSRSAYPAGSTFSYGAAGDESVTVTGSFTTPNGDNNVETMNQAIMLGDHSAFVEQGTATDVDSGSQAQSFVVDNTYTAGTFVQAMRVRGSASLTGLLWTRFATSGNGANINILSTSDTLNDVAYDSTTFNIDPGIKFDSTGTHSYAAADDVLVVKLTSSSGSVVSEFNKGETYYAEFYLLNSRGEKLTRSMTIAREDATPTTCASNTNTPSAGGLFSGTATLSTGATCTVVNTDPGSPRYFRATNTDQNHRSNQVFTVSSLYYLDAHIEKSSTLVKDDFPTENSAEDTSYIISTAVTDTTHLWCHVKSVRKDVDVDTSGSVITWSYIDGTSTTRFTGTTDTGSDGWTATHLDLLASTPLTPPNWTTRCAISSGSPFNGNYGTNDQTFTVTVPAAPTIWPGDPLRASCTPILGHAGGTIACTVSASNSDGSARTGAAASILYDLYNPSGTAVVTGGSVTEQGTTGVYSMTYSLGSSPALGNWREIFRTTDASPVTTHALFTVETDPTIALANSLASVLTDTGLIKGYTDQVEGNQATAATQVSGVATQVSGVQTTATEISGDTDTIIANQATAATQVSGIATQVSGVQTSANTIISNQAANLATILAEIESTEQDQDLLQNYTTQEVLDALASMNVTFTGNFTTDTAALGNLTTLLQEHRDASLELNGMSFDGLNFDGTFLLLLWLVALIWCMRNAKLFAALAATVGIACVLIPGPEYIGWVGVLFFVLALWLEAVARDKLPYHWFKGTTNKET